MSAFVDFFGIIGDWISSIAQTTILAFRVLTQGLQLPTQFGVWLTDPILQSIILIGVALVVVRFIITLL